MVTEVRDGRVDSTLESLRRELAELLERDPGDLPDRAHLIDELGLDSLTMMRVLVWLDGKGVTIDSDESRPVQVADVLALAEAAASPALSIRFTNGEPARLGGAIDLPPPPPQPADPLAPVLTGHGLRLDPVTPDDTTFLYTLATAPETCFRWRYRGAPPPYDVFMDDLWKQVVVQYVARRTADGRPVGHLVAYNPDTTAGFIYVAAVFVPAVAGAGVAADATARFVRYLFHIFPVAKVYLEVPGYNWPQVSSGEGELFQVEGRLRNHHYYAGRRWDQYLCAIYREPTPDGAR